mmetsp:Transcript_43859/g.95483  ORF Transcript_43859/g.95483 Transcript_43859/m.95483 type:complete len:394 (+) Transcript_43859:101-1282(+)
MADPNQSSLCELALEAWADCRPTGYTLDEERLPELLPIIASHVPDRSPGERMRERDMLFLPAHPGEAPVFLQLLRAQGGKVHFLYFWKAFSEAVRLAKTRLDEGLTSELEMLRDRTLRRLEEAATKSSEQLISRQVIPTAALTEELHRAASMSAYPRFWQAAAETLSGPLIEVVELNLDELTSVLLSWLHDAALWEAEGTETVGVYRESTTSSSSSRPVSASQGPPQQVGIPVRVHIYDVSQEESIQKLNRVLAHRRSPFKLGGVFHAGVEVNGLEWSFGFSASETRPGISCVEPKTHPQHTYRQTVEMRRTKVAAEDVADIITSMLEEYPGDDYDLLRRNCCHFADDFCKRLGVGGIPGWVHRLARIGAGVDAVLQAGPAALRDRVYGPFVP